MSAKKKKMKMSDKLVKHLENAGVKHNILEHKTVYTALDAVATMRKKMGEIAKSLFIKADKDYYLVILPADNNLDFEKLGKCIGVNVGKNVKVVKIPGEKIMNEILKIKQGAVGAFGKLHGLPVIVDKGLLKAKKAVFSSNSFNHSVEMAVKDFVKLENAFLGSFGAKKKINKTKAVKNGSKAVKPKKVVKEKRKAKKK